MASNWWDELFGMTPNAVGAASAANEPMVGKYRGANGSFDSNAIAGLGPAERAEEVRSAVGYANAAREIMPPEATRTPFQTAGHWLSALSVPAAYATGNTQYGAAMTGNTLQDQWLQRRDANTDARKKADYDLGAGLLSNQSDATAEYHKKKRADRDAAVKLVASSIVSAPAGQRQAAIAKAKEYLRAHGYTAEADSIEAGFASSASATPAAPAAPGAPSVTSPVPGIVIDGGSPASPAVAPAPTPSGQPQAPAASSAPYFSPKRAEAELIAAYNPERAKALLDEAKIEEEPYQAAAKKRAETLAESEADRQGQERDMAATASKVGKEFDLLADYGEVPGVDWYTGALDSSAIAPYTTDLLARVMPYNKASPAIRDQIRGTQMALVALLKKNIRAKGEGSQDQREFQAVVDTIGDMTNANTVEDYWRKLADSKKRVEALTGVKIPTTNKRLSAEDLETVDEPAAGGSEPAARVPAATAQIGETRTKVVNGVAVPHVKTAEGWVPAQAPAPQAAPSVPYNRAGRGR